MNRYFATNSLAGCRRTSVAVTAGDTTSGRFDSSVVSSCIRVGPNDYFEVGPFWNGVTSISGTLNIRFDSHQVNSSNASPLIQALNNGANAYRLMTSAGTAGTITVQMQYWNSVTAAWVNWGSSVALPSGINQTYRLQIVMQTSFDLTVSGTSVASSSTAPSNAASAITHVQFRDTNSSVTASNFGAFSQIMMADADIQNSTWNPLAINGEGTYTNGSGAYTDINESVLNESTAIALPAVGNKHTFTKAALTVPSGKQIGTLGCNVRGRVSGGIVADGKIMCRSSTTDSAPAAESFGSGYDPRGRSFDNDPNTGTRWTQSGLNAAEIGLLAA